LQKRFRVSSQRSDQKRHNESDDARAPDEQEAVGGKIVTVHATHDVLRKFACVTLPPFAT
jgi:hypothetical protein